MLDNTKDVQGVAVYVEFRKPGATMQLFITPDGYNTEGKEVPASLWRRVVTPDTPKKQWRNSSLGWRNVADLIAAGTPLANDKKAEFSENRLAFTTQLFDGLKNHGWAITKEPLFIETSKKDLDDVKIGKTPAKLMYRINQTRDAQGFPAAVA